MPLAGAQENLKYYCVDVRVVLVVAVDDEEARRDMTRDVRVCFWYEWGPLLPSEPFHLELMH